MKEISIIDSFKNIFDSLFSSSFFIAIIISFVVTIVGLLIFYIIKSSKSKIISITIFFLSLLVVPLIFYKFFLSTIDQFMTEVVRAIYFPTYYIYVLMLIIIYVNTFFVLKNKNKEKSTVKKIFDISQIIYFCIFQTLFFIIITIVVKEKISVFKVVDVFDNIKLASSVRISSYMFWLGSLFKILLTILNKILLKENKKYDEDLSLVTINEPIVKEENSKKEDNSFANKNIDKILGINSYDFNKNNDNLDIDNNIDDLDNKYGNTDIVNNIDINKDYEINKNIGLDINDSLNNSININGNLDINNKMDSVDINNNINNDYEVNKNIGLDINNNFTSSDKKISKNVDYDDNYIPGMVFTRLDMDNNLNNNKNISFGHKKENNFNNNVNLVKDDKEVINHINNSLTDSLYSLNDNEEKNDFDDFFDQ